MPNNQNPEQRARDRIDEQLRASGWTVQSLAALGTLGQLRISTIQRLYSIPKGGPLN